MNARRSPRAGLQSPLADAAIPEALVEAVPDPGPLVSAYKRFVTLQASSGITSTSTPDARLAAEFAMEDFAAHVEEDVALLLTVVLFQQDRIDDLSNRLREEQR